MSGGRIGDDCVSGEETACEWCVMPDIDLFKVVFPDTDWIRKQRVISRYNRNIV